MNEVKQSMADGKKGNGLFMNMDEQIRSELHDLDEDIIIRAELATISPTCKCMRSSSRGTLGF